MDGIATTRVAPPELTAAERRALRKLQVLKVEENPYGTHFIVGNPDLRLIDMRRAAAALAKLFSFALRSKRDKIGVKFAVNDEMTEHLMVVQLPGGGNSNDITWDDPDVRELVAEYLDPQFTGVANPTIEVVYDSDTGAYVGLMANIPVVRGAAKTLAVAAMVAVDGVRRANVQEKSISHGPVVRAGLETERRDIEAARAITRELCAVLGLEVAVSDDILVKDAHPERALFED